MEDMSCPIPECFCFELRSELEHSSFLTLEQESRPTDYLLQAWAALLSHEEQIFSMRAELEQSSFLQAYLEEQELSIQAQHSICSYLSIQSDPEPQTQPQLQLQQQLVGLDLENFLRQILLLSATDVIETLLLRFNHYFEEWKKLRNLRSGPSIPSSYSDMVYKLQKSELSSRFNEAMDCVESEFLRDLEMRGYGHAIELKEPLRQDLTVYLTKAKGEGGRNDVAHPFSTSVKQY